MPDPAGQPAAAPALGVGMAGYAFMGAAHSQGWRTAARVFDLPLRPVMVALCGRDATAAGAAAARLGWQRAETDWHALIGHATYADAILDRLVHNAHRLDLAGESLRKTKSNAKP